MRTPDSLIDWSEDKDEAFLLDPAFCRAVITVLVGRLPDKRAHITQKELDDVTGLILAEGLRADELLLGVFTKDTAPNVVKSSLQ